MALVSILTPVYNGEKYLHKCIKSVLAQSYSDWEYIIVNNCSQDGTLDIAQYYALQDRRIRIMNNTQFVDIIQNHNIAFEQISHHAEYCKVVQADDWIYPECIEKFVNIAEKNPTVILVSAYRLENDLIGLKGLPPSKSVFSGREIGRSFLLEGVSESFGSPTSHFLRAESVRSKKPFYNPHNIHADTEACFNVLRNGDLGFIHEVLTFTRRQEDTQTSRSHYLRTYCLGRLWILKNYGRDYLTEEEHQRCVQKSLRDYYLVLIRDLLNVRRGRDYWRYHLTSLRKVGYPFNPIKLLKAIPLAFIEKNKNKIAHNKVAQNI